jgi:hypothetical protein
MLEIRPIVVNKELVVLGGNMRLRACKEAGLKEVPYIIADDLTEEKQREFVIKDNVSGGEWDWDILANEWDFDEIKEWGVDVPFLGESGKINQVNELEEWTGMPDFEIKDESLKIIINFETEQDREEYAKEFQLEFTKKTQSAWSTWYPYNGRESLSDKIYE